MESQEITIRSYDHLFAILYHKEWPVKCKHPRRAAPNAPENQMPKKINFELEDRKDKFTLSICNNKYQSGRTLGEKDQILNATSWRTASVHLNISSFTT